MNGDRPFKGWDDFVEMSNIARKRLEHIEQLTKELEEVAEAIHYPDCWDTMAYPTLLDAITEINHCSACEAIQLSDCGDKE